MRQNEPRVIGDVRSELLLKYEDAQFAVAAEKRPREMAANERLARRSTLETCCERVR